MPQQASDLQHARQHTVSLGQKLPVLSAGGECTPEDIVLMRNVKAPLSGIELRLSTSFFDKIRAIDRRDDGGKNHL